MASMRMMLRSLVAGVFVCVAVAVDREPRCLVMKDAEINACSSDELLSCFLSECQDAHEDHVYNLSIYGPTNLAFVDFFRNDLVDPCHNVLLASADCEMTFRDIKVTGESLVGFVPEVYLDVKFKQTCPDKCGLCTATSTAGTTTTNTKIVTGAQCVAVRAPRCFFMKDAEINVKSSDELLSCFLSECQDAHEDHAYNLSRDGVSHYFFRTDLVDPCHNVLLAGADCDMAFRDIKVEGESLADIVPEVFLDVQFKQTCPNKCGLCTATSTTKTATVSSCRQKAVPALVALAAAVSAVAVTAMAGRR